MPIRPDRAERYPVLLEMNGKFDEIGVGNGKNYASTSFQHAMADSDNYSDKRSEDMLRRCAFKLLKEKGVELLIIDEAQHLSYRSTSSAASTTRCSPAGS